MPSRRPAEGSCEMPEQVFAGALAGFTVISEAPQGQAGWKAVGVSPWRSSLFGHGTLGYTVLRKMQLMKRPNRPDDGRHCEWFDRRGQSLSYKPTSGSASANCASEQQHTDTVRAHKRRPNMPWGLFRVVPSRRQPAKSLRPTPPSEGPKSPIGRVPKAGKESTVSAPNDNNSSNTRLSPITS